jgi:putative hemin transport protein
MHGTIHAIRNTFSTLRRKNKARHRDIAEQLGISEAELISAHVDVAVDDGNGILQSIRLKPDWTSIVTSLEPLGEVMALTRNSSCVHEKTGIYRNVSNNNQVGLVLGGEIDLRLFYQQWAHGFSVVEQTEQGVQRSVQFFDVEGTAIHKVFLTPHSDVSAYENLVTNFSVDDQSARIHVKTKATRPTELADTDIDVVGFHQAWRSLRHTHDFFDLLKRFGVTRIQAMRLADPLLVQQVENEAAHRLLQIAAIAGVPIQIFVGNSGMIQIHCGLIKKVSVMGPWLNVLDHNFNLHLREDHIASIWLVKKPTINGLVTSLELFDADGESIAMFFGERKSDGPESCEWRSLIENIQKESKSCLV